MLTFNPSERWSAGDLLKHKYFDDVREPQLEMKSSNRVSLDLMDSPGMYDYDGHVNHNLSLKDLTKLIDLEILNFK